MRAVFFCLLMSVLPACRSTGEPDRENPPSSSAGHASATGPAKDKPPQPSPISHPSVRELAAQTRAARYGVPLRSDEELDALLRSTCLQSRADGQPIVLDFGADWCGDCQRLHGLLGAPDLQVALSRVHLVELNLGAQRHEQLRRDFGVRAIPRWFVLAPEDCERSVSQWRRLGDRVLEQTPSATDLSRWLEGVVQSKPSQ